MQLVNDVGVGRMVAGAIKKWSGPLLAVLAFQSLVILLLLRFGVITAEENGAIENVQAIEMGLSAVVYGFIACRTFNGERLLHASLALLSLNFVLRELEIQDLSVPAWVISIGSGPGRDIFLTTAWLILVVLIVRHRERVWTAFRKWILAPEGGCTVLAGGFLILGAFFDMDLLPLSRSAALTCEELMEASGGLLLVVGAFWRNAKISRAPKQ